MKKWLCLVLFLTTLTYSITALLPSRVRVSAAEDDLQLHAKYAVLLDGDSGPCFLKKMPTPNGLWQAPQRL